MKFTKFIALAAALPLMSPAATYYKSAFAGSNWQIHHGSAWSVNSNGDPVASHTATAGNDYINAHGGFTRISPTSFGGVFPGDSYHQNGGTISYQPADFDFGDLTTSNNARFRVGGNGATVGTAQDISATSWNVAGTTDINIWTDKIATLTHTVNAPIHGRGQLTFSVADSADPSGPQTVAFNSPGSTWLGNIQLTTWGLEETLIVNFDNSHDLNNSKMGNLFITDNNASPTNTQLVLDQNFTFQNATLTYSGGSTTLGQGVYTYTDLQAIPVGAFTAADFFVNGGGTLNVIAVPEPSTFGLLSIGAVMLRRRFRRRK